ncbi:hypothetical protein B0T25DRAFT_253838 [Lasiosphaeria hispida]|uniref:GDS1 winged helix domain-containing protein n=1 Tax=Lasiosphaeria hispida TaxID=260671 RepID=A0AAJ0MCT5_9PEZI|nr:hypothetical protein B0T25DRAFT_253838 [Lasiosphaeria hispida]
MPYNTRRKSLSLPSLGIHIPVTNAARAAAANRAIERRSNNSARTTPSPTAMASPSREEPPPSKKLKRAHSDDMGDVLTSEPLPKRRDETVRFDHTPPQSPGAEQPSIEMDEDEDTATPKKIDLEGINDEIVEAVIVQLQNTGNRPHLVKELAAVLMQQLKIVQQSANPCAIISSRLASYLKRTCWTALAPCPLSKELESVHPRRTYFYLATCPHQPLPDPAQATTLSQLAHARAIISPSLSSATSGSEDADDAERRRELSPSPEVDLSSPEFDDMDDDIAMPTTPIGSLSLRHFPGMSNGHHHFSSKPMRNHRGASPPLEKDEKEFTQTADGLQKRKLRGDMLSATPSNSLQVINGMDMEYCGKDDSGLFGEKIAMSGIGPITFATSPAIRPSTMGPLAMPISLSLGLGKKDNSEAESWLRLENMLEWDRSPENVELDELDGLLDDY